MAGSSPRVRSRRQAVMGTPVDSGIISACAEQTAGCRPRPSRARDHLRVCGADVLPLRAISPRRGSSPRVRSRPPPACTALSIAGIISACAEQTPDGPPYARPRRDHLRVCGADISSVGRNPVNAGSSPRVRSGHERPSDHDQAAGIISACAERTLPRSGPQRGTRDHLRVCGADTGRPSGSCSSRGSSPRVRSGHPYC